MFAPQTISATRRPRSSWRKGPIAAASPVAPAGSIQLA
jgi:hypothetical protein